MEPEKSKIPAAVHKPDARKRAEACDCINKASTSNTTAWIN